jgi:hypothetical protein
MYTNKDKVRCILVIGQWRVEADVHVLSGSRLTDALNSKAKDFIAVTDAKVYDMASNQVLYAPQYLAVNRDSIAVIFPIE